MAEVRKCNPFILSQMSKEGFIFLNMIKMKIWRHFNFHGKIGTNGKCDSISDRKSLLFQ